MKKVFKIKGMHCNSCAVNIEGELENKVNSIKVSYSKEEAEIDFNPEKISEEEIKQIVKKLGYELVEEEKKSEKRNKTGWIVASISLVLFLAVLYFLVLKNLNLPEIPIPQIGENASLILLFAAGLLVGFHCISMCGGFVVSYTAKNAIKGHKSFKQHLVYGGSKVVSYTIIGGIFGLIGGVIAFSTKLRGFVAIFAGVFMLFYALSMFGFKFFRKFQIHPKFLTKVATKEQKGFYKGPFFTGLLNGLFIACGPLQAMYLYAAGTGNFFSGMTSLAAFGLGTLPIMFGFGSLTTVISHKTTQRILKVSAVIVLILGIIMLNRGLALAGSPVTFDSIKTGILGASGNVIDSGNSVVVKDGVQEVNMEVTSSGYSPNSFVVKQGVPVKWNVNVPQLFSCSNELIMNAYGIDVHLKQGLNVIEFTPTKTGTIPFTCGMGMLHGSFIVTETGTASQQQVAAATPKAGGSCSMGSGGGGCGCGG
jgi:sulfite exporter TauE/SafE/copper chaperone CopZ